MSAHLSYVEQRPTSTEENRKEEGRMMMMMMLPIDLRTAKIMPSSIHAAGRMRNRRTKRE